MMRHGTSTAMQLAFALASISMAYRVNQVVPQVYMDEIFHVPQAQSICRGEWQYDPKLTTPPGLYLLSLLLSKVMPGVQCSDLAFLRSTNLIMMLCLPHLLASILAASEDEQELRRIGQGEGLPGLPPPEYHNPTLPPVPSLAKRRIPRSTIVALQNGRPAPLTPAPRRTSDHTAQAHTLCLLPPLYFFSFLYYTDVGSLFFVLLTLYALQRQRRILGACYGGVSLLFRQTNVVWLLFLLLSQLAGQVGLYTLHDLPVLWRKRGHLMRGVAPFLPVFLGFAWFLHWNGGVVLGDKSNHQAATHGPQVLYFLLFACAFGWPALVHRPGRPQVLLGIAVATAGTWAVHTQTYTHPFLLADNRHYTFYVWRITILRHENVKYLFVPLYAAAATAWAATSHASQIWGMGFAAALGLTLVPAPLVEPRYFLTAYTLLRLTAKRTPPRLLALEASASLLLNLITLYLFLARPFSWPPTAVDTLRHESTIMRFMW